MRGWRSGDEKLSRKVEANGRITYATTTPITKKASASEYFGFVTTLCLVFGLVMEYPIVLVLLAKVGIITSARLRSSRRVVILAIAIISAVVTPGGDPISPTVLGLTMYLLYEFSIVLIRLGGR